MTRFILVFGLILAATAVTSVAQENKSTATPEVKAKVKQGPTASFVIPVPLPIRGGVDQKIRSSIDQLLASLTAETPSPMLILEFKSDDKQHGDGSEFERCLSLARYLTNARLNKVRSVAFIPGTLRGHAILPALACEEIVIHPDADFGAAGIDEPILDDTIRQAYQTIATRRGTIPVAVVLGMLDRSLVVLQAETADGKRMYVLSSELEALKQKTAITQTREFVARGDLASFSGQQLRATYRWASHLARDRNELASGLGLVPGTIQDNPSLGSKWKGVQIVVQGRVTQQLVQQVQREVDQALTENKANFLCLLINSPGGSPTNSVALGNFLAGLDSTKVRTVAFITERALGDAAIIAMACDDLVMVEDSILGGAGETFLHKKFLADMREPLQQIAAAKGRDWSLLVGLIDQTIPVYSYRNRQSGEERLFTKEELQAKFPQDQQLPQDQQQWQRGEQISTSKGIIASDAQQLQVARHVVRNMDELMQRYGLETLEKAETNWMVHALEQLAMQPWFARTLLFIAFFALISEASAPGVGIPGFVSALCFLLFFWVQFLNGTAGWLEVLLFLGGITFLMLEILIIPGFGVFGIGGALMVISSLILASQTFVIPRNSYQFQQVPSSFLSVTFAGAGMIIAMIVMRKVLPHAPVFRRLMLNPIDGDQLNELETRESLVDLAYLMQKRGFTTTQLTPSGKARLGDEVVDVISEGELIERGADIVVSEVHGNRVIVRRI